MKKLLTCFTFIVCFSFSLFSQSNANEVKIGVLYPLTGPVAQVGIDARLCNDAHGVDIEHEEVVRGKGLLLLVNERKELNVVPHIIERLERQVDVMVLLLVLQVNQFPEGDDLRVFLEDDVVAAEEVVVLDDRDLLVHLNQ